MLIENRVTIENVAPPPVGSHRRARRAGDALELSPYSCYCCRGDRGDSSNTTTNWQDYPITPLNLEKNLFRFFRPTTPPAVVEIQARRQQRPRPKATSKSHVQTARPVSTSYARFRKTSGLRPRHHDAPNSSFRMSPIQTRSERELC